MRDGVIGKLNWKSCQTCTNFVNGEVCEPVQKHGSGIIFAEVKTGKVICIEYGSK